MSRRDPGSASGGVAREPRRCACGQLESLHTLTGGKRGGMRGTACRKFEPINVVAFPGAGITPAPAGPRIPPADLDAIGDRWTALCEARIAGDARKARLLEAACADDIPALRDYIHGLELAAALTGGA